VGGSRARWTRVLLGLSLSLLLALQALGTSSPAAAQGPGRRAPVVDSAAGPAEAVAVPTELTPLIADFDGDHRSDVFWYGPGGTPDHVYLGRPDRAFVGVPVAVNRSYLPLVGDFNGNGRADILWYGPGANADVLWLGQAGGRFAGLPVTVRGTYEPFTGDFNGDHRGDIFWYGPGAAGDALWYGRADGSFASRAVSVLGTYQPLVADFNGDGRSDVLWYGPGANRDALWLGRGAGGFTSRSATVRGTYQPLVGDWNGDHSRDVLWYGPGADPDALWFGHPDGRFTARTTTVRGTYQPFTGDFNGDHKRDVFWYAPGVAGDAVWYGRSDGSFASSSRTITRPYRPKVGDFGGDGRSDVFWYAPGGPDDILWFGQPTRQFTSRATTIDIGHTRAVPLRQATIAEQYDPYGFVAHAFGAIDGHTYTNSLEAFQRNYGRGFRVFEVDVVRLKDGTALLAHDGLEANYGLNKPFREATWADLAGHKYGGRYTILRSQDLVGLLRDHPDAYVILDSKYSRVEIYRTFLRQAPERGLRERIFPHVQDQAELNAYRTAYPLQNYVVALYHTQYWGLFDDPEVIDFTRRNRTPAVMMWWRQRDLSISLAANHRQSRRFRTSFVNALEAAGAVTYVHSLGDPTQIQRFWDLGVGVYSDEPFPPLGTTPPQLLTPTFEEGVTPA
jgi:glycerophosphoryl diester phosphodiesterase